MRQRIQISTGPNAGTETSMDVARQQFITPAGDIGTKLVPYNKGSKAYKADSLTPVQLIKQSKDGQYGNDPYYYKKRGAYGFNDPRITLFNESYITNKEVLDLGCHNGSLSLQIGKKFPPNKIKQKFRTPIATPKISRHRLGLQTHQPSDQKLDSIRRTQENRFPRSRALAQ
jgi:hypothetical protein